MSLPIAAKLGDHNYNAWKYEMQAVLMQKGLWLIVSGEESAPKDTNTPAFKEWRSGDMQAAGLIYNLVEPSVHPLIRDFITSGTRMWAALASHYEQDNAAVTVQHRSMLSQQPCLSHFPVTRPLLIIPGWLHFAPLHSIAFQKLLLFFAYSVALRCHVTSCDVLVGSM